MESKGLGDTIEKITIATGLKSLSDIASRALGYRNCKCDKRKAWLNKQFPYKIKKDGNRHR
jgi:hypothetical protein|tara:strand:+ start:710 stop:892 length:183 start_codon:yes stop_codon:yes gene_type:complete